MKEGKMTGGWVLGSMVRSEKEATLKALYLKGMNFEWAIQTRPKKTGKWIVERFTSHVKNYDTLLLEDHTR